MNIHFITFGCKVNIYETENMKQDFRRHGYTVSENEEEADIFIVNTCTVTETGDKKVFKELRRLRREHPEAVIAVTGCFPQAFPDEAEKVHEADIILGTKNRRLLPLIMEEYLQSGNRRIEISGYSRKEPFEYMCNEGYTNNTRAFIKIQDGCNMFCSYCIIPYSRGGFRSKPIEELKAEAGQLVKSGYKEIVLVGINLSFYGIEYGLRLADAVEAVCRTDGILRVRLGSLEPEMITGSDIKRLSAQEKLCPQFHLSLQSGCDSTLKAMNRRYTAEEYAAIVSGLRRSFVNCSVTTDVMVGFPGETEADFKASLEFIRKTGFSKIHVFPYSQRRGTPAADMENQIPARIKSLRADMVSDIAKASQRDFLESQTGLTVPVLFEREKSDGIPHGYTPNYTQVKIFTKYSDKSLRNEIFYVKIIKSEHDYCVGEIIY